MNATNNLKQDNLIVRRLGEITQRCSERLYANAIIPFEDYTNSNNCDLTANEHLKKACYDVGLPIKTCLHCQFIMKLGTKVEQEILAHKGSSRTIEKIYKRVFKRYLQQHGRAIGN